MIVGIFVGGKSTRMGGFPKGRLPAADSAEPLIVRTRRLLSALSVTPVLVGEASPYADLLPDVPRLSDQPAEIGPLGGLGALLAAAEAEHVIALACDMPSLSLAILEKLVLTPGSEDVLAPKGSAGLWEPFCARYRVASVRPALAAALSGGERSFRALFARLSVAELVLDAHERSALRDWDAREDMEHES